MKIAILIVSLVSCRAQKYNDIHIDFEDLPSHGWDFLTLIESPDPEQTFLNNKFEGIATSMGLAVQKKFVPENTIFYTVSLSQHFRNVINLKMTNDLFSSINNYQTFADSNLRCVTECENLNLTYTGLADDALFKYDKLIAVIENEDLELKDYIQICLPSHTTRIPFTNLVENERWPQINIQLGDCSTIELEESMVALITNEPPHTESSLPVIFYQTSYPVPEVKDWFPNSMSMSTTWQPLKFAFRHFLQHMTWTRVAILSDDTAYSQDFRRELIPLLQEDGITFTDQQCKGRNCDFLPSLRLLKQAEARILILNIDKTNGIQLENIVNALKLVDVTWVLRDWPFDKDIRGMSNMFSISLSSVFEEQDKYYPYQSSIKQGIQIIDSIYKDALGNKEEIQRRLSKVHPLTGKACAYVTHVHKKRDPTLVLGMTIEGDRTSVFFSTSTMFVISDIPQACIVRSRDYFKPCSHEELLILLCVILMFALAMLVIILFFNMYRQSRFYNRFS